MTTACDNVRAYGMTARMRLNVSGRSLYESYDRKKTFNVLDRMQRISLGDDFVEGTCSKNKPCGRAFCPRCQKERQKVQVKKTYDVFNQLPEEKIHKITIEDFAVPVGTPINEIIHDLERHRKRIENRLRRKYWADDYVVVVEADFCLRTYGELKGAHYDFAQRPEHDNHWCIAVHWHGLIYLADQEVEEARRYFRTLFKSSSTGRVVFQSWSKDEGMSGDRYIQYMHKGGYKVKLNGRMDMPDNYINNGGLGLTEYINLVDQVFSMNGNQTVLRYGTKNVQMVLQHHQQGDCNITHTDIHSVSRLMGYIYGITGFDNGDIYRKTGDLLYITASSVKSLMPKVFFPKNEGKSSKPKCSNKGAVIQKVSDKILRFRDKISAWFRGP